MDTHIRKMAQLLDNDQFLEKVGVTTKSSLQDDRPPWQDFTVSHLGTDNGLLVTHINKTKDLLRVQMKKIQSKKVQTTEEWLRNYSLESLQLTLEHLVNEGNIILNSRNGVEEIEFTEETVTDFESRLSKVIELYQQRIQWLLQDSRKVFGLIKGTKVGLVVDVSHMSYRPRLLDFQKDLLCLIDEQLCYKKQLYCLSFSTEISPLWESPKNINVHVLHEARQWIQQLEPGQGCNLLKALKHVLTMKELNSLVLIVGSCPDQSLEILSDYAQQCVLGRKLQTHAVTYDCSHPGSLAVIKNLAEAVRGHYHCYSSKGENFDSSDVHLLLQESQKAKDLLKSIKQTFQRRIRGSLISRIADVSTEFANTAPSNFLPKPPKHEGPLVIQTPCVLAKTSADWLKTNGLKAKKLNLYQVLAPNAFSPVEEFVPILKKTVSSTLHEKAMMQFEWYDGTVKNIHVDLPVLYKYQKLLAKMVRIYEKRIDWLSVASRRIWGSVCERRVVILVDISVTNSMYIIRIQHSLRLLLEEQMSNKDYFNIIAFGSDVVPWQLELVPSQPENLQNAWRWVLSLQCKGSRNFMSALRRAVEVDFKDKDKHKSQGLYLLTTGIPDQETHTISAYVAEVCRGFDLQLHVCLFSVMEDVDFNRIIPARYANPTETATAFKEIVQAANGRFHWFGEAGIFESNDITVILSEMEKANNYSQKNVCSEQGGFLCYVFEQAQHKGVYIQLEVLSITRLINLCTFLVEALKQRSVNQSVNPFIPEEDSKMLTKKEKRRPQKLQSPKPTALSLARMYIKDNHGAERNASVRVLAWRPTSAKPEIPPAQTIKEWPQTENKRKHKPRKQPEFSVSAFYTDKGRNVGTVYRKYPKIMCIRKLVPSVTLPKKEEICSSKEWLTKYSIKKLKLELPRLMFGPGCTHQKKTVESLHKKVSAKYCTIFPSVEINGVVKHLQFQSKELEIYTEQLEKVLQRYIQRIQWLLSGSRRLFGTILEANVCVLIDTSGSMDPYLPHVTKELTSLIWEQLRKNEVRFNLLRFAENTEIWKECLVEATDETCHDAVQWVSKFHAHGNTCILMALQKALSFQGIEALYVLTDGKPDTSCSLILKEIERLRKKQDIKIHTISFSCTDRGANEFLKKLASQTGGRYHCSFGDVDGQLAAHRMLTEGLDDEDDPVFPYFEGDDLKKLTQEVAKARRFLKQAKSLRLLLQKWNINQKDDSDFKKSAQERFGADDSEIIRHANKNKDLHLLFPSGMDLQRDMVVMQEGSTEELHSSQPCESKLNEHAGPLVNRSRKTMVTGGGGYLGYNLGCALVRSGIAVVLFDVRNPKWEIPNGADFFKGDVRDYDAVFKACEGVDCVFHVAACGMSGLEQLQKKDQIESINVGGTKIIIDVCKQRNIPRLIYTSTVNVVFGGNPIEEGDEETVPYFPLEKQFNHYSRTKAIADQMVLAANGTLLEGGDRLHTCVLRPPGIYGPEEQRHLPRVAVNIQRRLFNFKFGNHKVQMNWVHIGNLVQAHLLAAEALTSEKGYVASGQAYYIHDGENVIFSEWIVPLFEKLGYRKPCIHIPVLLVHIAATVMEYLHLILKPVFSFTPFLTRNEVWNVTVTHTFRIDKARNQLGYKPKKFSFADSVDHYLKTRPTCQEDHTLLKMVFAFGILLSLIILSFF